MTSFEPIAIVGRACVLPDALSPEELWTLVSEGRDAISDTPAGRWRVESEDVLCAPDEDPADKTWSNRAGYVRGFEQIFDPTGFLVAPDALEGLDPGFLWALHCAREALKNAGESSKSSNVSAVYGLLGFPSEEMTRYAEAFWFNEPRPDARNRFMASHSVGLMNQALGLSPESICLDTACASSLYAIKIACDQLHDRRVDVVLAGAVNRSDDLFIHIGFSALKAMSPSGRSRPFHAEADGLVPAEGAGFVALKRLTDARRDGNTIYGVIRGVGLSNDGRGRGFLAPLVDGQKRALERAYRVSGINPAEVSLLECHATGTSVGDATELRSTGAVFGKQTGVPIGSLKSNTGHLITAAGVAGLIKVLEAMRHGLRPPTLHADVPNPVLNETPFRLLHKAEPWATTGPRIAGISAFGFGGNNAHLLVSEDDPALLADATPTIAREPVALVGVGAVVGNATSVSELKECVMGDRHPEPGIQNFNLAIKGLKFPPNDLEETLPQQLVMLKATREALRGIDYTNTSTGVFMAYEPDPEVCRYGARWRLGELMRQAGTSPEEAPRWYRRNRDSIVETLTSAGVVGTMPNILANRLNSQFDLQAASITVTGLAESGLRALDLASRALAAGEVDTAIVGGVDLSSDPINRRALEDLGFKVTPGDAAIVLVLKRPDDARRAGDTILAEISRGQCDPASSWNEYFGSCEVVEELRDLVLESLTGAGLFSVGRIWPFTVNVPTALSPARPDYDGPTLEFRAHRPPVRIEELPNSNVRAALAKTSLQPPTQNPRQNSMQKMPQAPYLPQIGTIKPPPLAREQAPPQSRATNGHHSGNAKAVGTQKPNGNVPKNGSPHLGSLQQSLAEIGELQRQFLANQTAVFEQYMAVQNYGLQQLQQARGGQAVHGGQPVHAKHPTPDQYPVRHAEGNTSPEGTPGAMHPKGETHAGQPTPQTPPIRTQGGNSSPEGKMSTKSTEGGTISAPPRKLANVDVGAPEKPTIEPDPREPFGPTWNRDDLKIHASGNISEIFGEQFKVQDAFERQVRMPEPPLLLADRVTGIDAEPGSMNQTGTIWTESDIYENRWYLHQGHIPAGIMIESGQADLMLISYLGVDFVNKGDRIYRLLGCELTYKGGLPQVGDTMKYDIHLDAHAAQGNTRLMFFHYDCQVDDEVRLSVRKGQAGFFTDEELANSEGCIWKPETQEIVENPRLDAPFVELSKTQFTEDEVRAFSDGRPWDCFGPEFDWAKTHTRTPQIQGGKMFFLSDVELENRGGPWGRGYMKSTVEIDPDHWFFDGHFKNDPCMPGTLMFEGCLQALAFHLTAQGYTLERDGWRFEPVEDEPFALNCRGQVTPESKVLTYEVFVEEVIDGPEPTVYADLLCTVDGLKAFHARRVGLRLVPAWPLDQGSKLLVGYEETRHVADANGFEFDYHSMLACANGRPSQAFGPVYEPFDSPLRVARLPNPPYHFLSRVARVEGEIGSMQKGMEVDVEYDIPEDAWYFDENGCRTMPFAVLLEAALQPCGWLASYLGCALTVENKELFFRNLDGTGTLHVDLVPDSEMLLTKVKSTGISKTGPMIIVSFDVECFAGDTLVYDMDTVFGFFPAEALQNQVGLPTTDDQRALLEAESQVVADLTTRPDGYWLSDGPALAEPMMLMIDRVTYFDPEGGEAGLGTLRADKDVDPAEWFFKAHFFQDPVQPGSLGIEAMIQLLQFYMLETGMHEGIEDARFETLSHAHALTWKYRGQVIPTNKLIQTTIEITETGRDDDGPFAVATASLWVDGKRIYEAFNMGMRIVSGGAGDKPTFTLDPEEDTWLEDHCPTYALPALPMMSMVDYLAQAASVADPVTSVEDVRVKGWLAFDGAKTMTTRRRADQVELLWIADDGAENTVASGKVKTGMYGMRPAPWAPLEGDEVESPYQTGQLFHGEAFQILESLVRTGEGASAILRADGELPKGRLSPLLLDGITHAIPHDDLQQWDERYPADKVAYPAFIPRATFYGKTPTRGTVRVEVRPDGMMGSPDFPAFAAQVISDEGVWCEMRLVEACFPKGTLGSADSRERRAFLRDRAFVEGLALSTFEGGKTILDKNDVEAIDWLRGTVENVYGTTDAEEIARREHIAHEHNVHPGTLPDALPLTHIEDLEIARKGELIRVCGDASGELDITSVKDFWTDWFGRTDWPVEDLYYGLIERFVNRVVLTDPQAFAKMDGRSLLYLGNHQVGVESLLFSIIASALNSVPTLTLAKIEHKETWLGQLIDLCFRYPEIKDPGVIAFFDREDRESLPKILKELAAEMAGIGRSVMVHVEGTRSLECRTPVQKMSGAFIDMALKVNTPVVPIRFVGALPTDPLEKRLEFPLNMGKQDIYIGRPLMPEELAAVPYGARKEMVIDAINALGPANSEETPYPGDPDFAQRVDAWLEDHSVTPEHAVLREVLAEATSPTGDTKKLLGTSSADTIDTSTPEGEWLGELAERLLGRKNE